MHTTRGALNLTLANARHAAVKHNRSEQIDLPHQQMRDSLIRDARQVKKPPRAPPPRSPSQPMS